MAEIRAVLFDFGGVLAEEGFSNGLQRLAKEQGLNVDTITESGMQAVYDSGFVLGKGSEADFWALLRERTGLQGDDAFFREQIFNAFVIRPWMLALVAKLGSRGYLTGILSDQVDWLDTLDARDHFYSYFDHIYNSYYMGKGKRDPTHFTDVASDLDLPPAQILFIDDSERNVATAKSIGMQAIHYVDRQGFIKLLEERLDIEQL